MVEVLALICMVNQPETCKDLRLSFAAENPTPFQCFHYGQMALAQWVTAHPGWEIKRGFKCGRVGQFAKA